MQHLLHSSTTRCLRIYHGKTAQGKTLSSISRMPHFKYHDDESLTTFFFRQLTENNFPVAPNKTYNCRLDHVNYVSNSKLTSNRCPTNHITNDDDNRNQSRPNTALASSNRFPSNTDTQPAHQSHHQSHHNTALASSNRFPSNTDTQPVHNRSFDPATFSIDFGSRRAKDIFYRKGWAPNRCFPMPRVDPAIKPAVRDYIKLVRTEVTHQNLLARLNWDRATGQD